MKTLEEKYIELTIKQIMIDIFLRGMDNKKYELQEHMFYIEQKAEELRKEMEPFKGILT